MLYIEDIDICYTYAIYIEYIDIAIEDIYIYITISYPIDVLLYIHVSRMYGV